MLKIHVHKPFQLTLHDGTSRYFPQGIHEVESPLADHWYVQVHANVVPDPMAKPNTEPAKPTGKK